MSASYADLLSPYPHKGILGSKEIVDSENNVADDVEQLVVWWRDAKTTVVISGAGISTACGIPDFRGPSGVWTLETTNQKPDSVKFEDAIPSFTHSALVSLESVGKIQYLISQNVDGLHPRSGFPLNRLSEVHGNVFKAICNSCHGAHYQETAIASVGLKPFGKCPGKPDGRPCRGMLTDSALDWNDELPEKDLRTSLNFVYAADLIICLGTSLQIQPVGNFPLETQKRGGRFVTVNLQATAHEEKADLTIHAKCDDVLKRVLSSMGIDSVEYKKPDYVQVSQHVMEQFTKKSRKSSVESRGNTKKVKKDVDLQSNDAPLVDDDDVNPVNVTVDEDGTMETPHRAEKGLLHEVDTNTAGSESSLLELLDATEEKETEVQLAAYKVKDEGDLKATVNPVLVER